MMSSEPTRDELVALEEKYGQLEELRLARGRNEPIPERAVFKRLANRFPGALRELDTLPLSLIVERRRQLGQTLAGGEIWPWMAWIATYHRLMCAALWIKLRTEKNAYIDDERMASLLRGLPAEFGFGVDEAFVRDVAQPRTGRIHSVVFTRLEKIFGVNEAEIRAEILGARRSG